MNNKYFLLYYALISIVISIYSLQFFKGTTFDSYKYVDVAESIKSTGKPILNNIYHYADEYVGKEELTQRYLKEQPVLYSYVIAGVSTLLSIKSLTAARVLSFLSFFFFCAVMLNLTKKTLRTKTFLYLFVIGLPLFYASQAYAHYALTEMPSLFLISLLFYSLATIHERPDLLSKTSTYALLSLLGLLMVQTRYANITFLPGTLLFIFFTLKESERFQVRYLIMYSLTASLPLIGVLLKYTYPDSPTGWQYDPPYVDLFYNVKATVIRLNNLVWLGNYNLSLRPLRLTLYGAGSLVITLLLAMGVKRSSLFLKTMLGSCIFYIVFTSLVSSQLYGIDPISERYLSQLTPFILLFLFYALENLKLRKISLALGLLMIFGNVWGTTYFLRSFNKDPDYQKAISFINESTSPNALILTGGNEMLPQIKRESYYIPTISFPREHFDKKNLDFLIYEKKRGVWFILPREYESDRWGDFVEDLSQGRTSYPIKHINKLDEFRIFRIRDLASNRP